MARKNNTGKNNTGKNQRNSDGRYGNKAKEKDKKKKEDEALVAFANAEMGHAPFAAQERYDGILKQKERDAVKALQAGMDPISAEVKSFDLVYVDLIAGVARSCGITVGKPFDVDAFLDRLARAKVDHIDNAIYHHLHATDSSVRDIDVRVWNDHRGDMHLSVAERCDAWDAYMKTRPLKGQLDLSDGSRWVAGEDGEYVRSEKRTYRGADGHTKRMTPDQAAAQGGWEPVNGCLAYEEHMRQAAPTLIGDLPKAPMSIQELENLEKDEESDGDGVIDNGGDLNDAVTHHDASVLLAAAEPFLTKTAFKAALKGNRDKAIAETTKLIVARDPRLIAVVGRRMVECYARSYEEKHPAK